VRAAGANRSFSADATLEVVRVDHGSRYGPPPKQAHRRLFTYRQSLSPFNHRKTL
jgi:hypothetical protein